MASRAMGTSRSSGPWSPPAQAPARPPHIEGASALGSVATLLAVAIPTGIFIGGVYLIYSVLTRSVDPFHIPLLASTGVVLVASIAIAAAGASLAWCLLVLALSPWISVLGLRAPRPPPRRGGAREPRADSGLERPRLMSTRDLPRWQSRKRVTTRPGSARPIRQAPASQIPPPVALRTAARLDPTPTPRRVR